MKDLQLTDGEARLVKVRQAMSNSSGRHVGSFSTARPRASL